MDKYFDCRYYTAWATADLRAFSSVTSTSNAYPLSPPISSAMIWSNTSFLLANKEITAPRWWKYKAVTLPIPCEAPAHHKYGRKNSLK